MLFIAGLVLFVTIKLKPDGKKGYGWVLKITPVSQSLEQALVLLKHGIGNAKALIKRDGMPKLFLLLRVLPGSQSLAVIDKSYCLR